MARQARVGVAQTGKDQNGAGNEWHLVPCAFWVLVLRWHHVATAVPVQAVLGPRRAGHLVSFRIAGRVLPWVERGRMLAGWVWSRRSSSRHGQPSKTGWRWQAEDEMAQDWRIIMLCLAG